MTFQVRFVYVAEFRKWDVRVDGAASPLEALQGFNAVLMTASIATPDVNKNRAELQSDGSYKISIGV